MGKGKSIGNAGELSACEFLISKGYTIRETNWRLGHLEIDIIAQEANANHLHIVEVKTRTSTEHFDPMEAINPKKIRNLVNAANGYISHNELQMTVQFDVMIIEGTEPDYIIHFYPDAFEPPLRTVR